MDIGSRLVVKSYHIEEVNYGKINQVNINGTMFVQPEVAAEICNEEPLIEDIQIRIIQPDEHNQHTNTIMDVIPLSTKVSGQGAVYDTRMFGKEPASFEQGKSVIDMGCMPVIVTPNEFRDGIMRAMD